MEDNIARAARAKKGSPFLSTEQAGFYLGLSARKLQA
ncbi:MAG: DNA-binding protein, partial [Alphaproteobacteria bacterium]|nr:DNA-binding protein [Alphaproteobacteria bacterium]